MKNPFKNPFIKCPYCGATNLLPEDFIEHLQNWQITKSHPKTSYEMLKEMVEKGQIKIEVS